MMNIYAASNKKWPTISFLFLTFIFISIVLNGNLSLAGGSHAGGGGFDQAFAYIKKFKDNNIDQTLPEKTTREICKRFISYGVDGLDLINLLIRSGGITNYNDPIITDIRPEGKKNAQGHFEPYIRNYFNDPFEISINTDAGTKYIVSDQMISDYANSSYSICDKNQFRINLDIKDSNNNSLVARKYRS